MATCKTWANPEPYISTTNYQILPVQYSVIVNAPGTTQTLPSLAMVNGDNTPIIIKDNGVCGTILNTPDGVFIDDSLQFVIPNYGCATVFPNKLGGWAIETSYGTGGGGGTSFHKGILSTATTIPSGYSTVFTVNWNNPFLNTLYNVFSINAESDGNSILIPTVISGSKTLTSVDIQIYNLSVTPANNIKIYILGE